MKKSYFRVSSQIESIIQLKSFGKNSPLKSNLIKQAFSISNVTSADKSFFYMVNITGSEEVKIKSVMFKTGYASSSGGYGFSVKLEPNPPNGKSCQVVFGDMGANKALTKNAPASCEDLQLTTNSQIGVSKSSNQWGAKSKNLGGD